jgi:hypothetical protein
VAQARRFIEVQAVVNPNANPVECVCKLEIRWSGVDGIRAGDDEGIDLAGAHLADEVAERREVIRGDARLTALHTCTRIRRLCSSRSSTRNLAFTAAASLMSSDQGAPSICFSTMMGVPSSPRPRS